MDNSIQYLGDIVSIDVWFYILVAERTLNDVSSYMASNKGGMGMFR